MKSIKFSNGLNQEKGIFHPRKILLLQTRQLGTDKENSGMLSALELKLRKSKKSRNIYSKEVNTNLINKRSKHRQ